MCLVGVDFQVKSLVVDGHVIALQLWDTAGQERYGVLITVAMVRRGMASLLL